MYLKKGSKNRFKIGLKNYCYLIQYLNLFDFNGLIEDMLYKNLMEKYVFINLEMFVG